MKHKQSILSRALLLLLCLLAVCALVACADIERRGAWETAVYDKDTDLGEGSKTITVKVIAEEQSLTFTLHTDKENLEDALLEHQLVAGDMGQFGLYIKSVNGIVADYDADGSYWAITKNGADTLSAKDTLIADGECYELTKAVFSW